MKKSRHQRIKELVEQFEIETQEELADRLRGEEEGKGGGCPPLDMGKGG